MAGTTFTGKIAIRGINPYVAVSAARAAAIKPKWRRPMPVLVRINGKPATPWRVNMMPTGTGSFYLYLHGDVRKASDTKVGDSVRVAITFDAKYKNGPLERMPTWFKAALIANPLAYRNWRKLIPSRKKEIIRYLARLKSVDARERNLRRALTVLSGNTARFMARSWS